MAPLPNQDGKPRILISNRDYERLSDLARGALDRTPEVAEELQNEMDRADIVPVAALPADTVRMGSTVAFRNGSDPRREVTLVFPGEADIAAGRISILTPIGTALIGLSAGQSIRFAARDGRERELTVLAVEQPGGTDR
ncbi:MAG: nucleoside diphosphate kinase regulator [Alphaproteobacteria bacterium]